MSTIQSGYAHWIGGDWREPSDGRHLDALDPSTGLAWASIARGSAADVEAAVGAAKSAFPGWAGTPPRARGALLRRLADVLAEHAEELARLESRDNGKLLREVRPLVAYLPEYYRYYGELVDKVGGETIHADKPDMFAFREWEALGPCAVVTPWNSPLYLLSTKLPAALAAGNTVVVKPSEHASVSTLEVARLFSEAGLPAGVLNVVTGLGPEAGACLVSHRDIRKVAFTGGLAGARSVIGATAQNLARLTLELGGKSPQLIFDDADLSSAVSGVLAGVFAASGQSCVAGSRVYVQRGRYQEFVDALAERVKEIRIGRPDDPSCDIGPLAVEAQLETVSDFVAEAVGQGARVVTGGSRWNGEDGGWYFEPTILCDVSPESRVLREEVFGPVVVISPFDTEEEAVLEANGTDYGLASGIWTRDLARAHRIIPQLNAGLVWVNTYRVASPMVPFGGRGLSGYGLEGGPEGLLEFMQSKSVWINVSTDAIDDPFKMR